MGAGGARRAVRRRCTWRCRCRSRGWPDVWSGDGRPSRRRPRRSVRCRVCVAADTSRRVVRRRLREVLALVGASGSGKTTLLRAIAGLDPIEAGKIDVAGTSLVLARCLAARPVGCYTPRRVASSSTTCSRISRARESGAGPCAGGAPPRPDAERQAAALLESLGVGHGPPRCRTSCRRRGARVAIAGPGGRAPGATDGRAHASLYAGRRTTSRTSCADWRLAVARSSVATHDEEFVRAGRRSPHRAARRLVAESGRSTVHGYLIRAIRVASFRTACPRPTKPRRSTSSATPTGGSAIGTAYYRLNHWPIGIVFLIAPDPDVRPIRTRLRRQLVRVAVACARRNRIAGMRGRRRDASRSLIIRFTGTTAQPLYRRICYTTAWGGHRICGVEHRRPDVGRRDGEWR